MHLISHTEHEKAQSAEAPGLPHGSVAATVPFRVLHSSSTNTEVRWGWKGGKEDAASSDGSIASPVLHYSEPTSKDCPQLWLRADGSPMQCCLPQGNGRSLWDQGRRNSLGERLTSSPQWQDRHYSGTEPQSQPKEHTSANFPQCQLYRPGCLTAVPRISSKPGLTLFCNRKDRAYDWTFIPSSLLIISPGNLNVPLISSIVELNIYTNHIYKYI